MMNLTILFNELLLKRYLWDWSMKMTYRRTREKQMSNALKSTTWFEMIKLFSRERKWNQFLDQDSSETTLPLNSNQWEKNNHIPDWWSRRRRGEDQQQNVECRSNYYFQHLLQSYKHPTSVLESKKESDRKLGKMRESKRMWETWWNSC